MKTQLRCHAATVDRIPCAEYARIQFRVRHGNTMSVLG
jgi:hypothetical protein